MPVYLHQSTFMLPVYTLYSLILLLMLDFTYCI